MPPPLVDWLAAGGIEAPTVRQHVHSYLRPVAAPLPGLAHGTDGERQDTRAASASKGRADDDAPFVASVIAAQQARRYRPLYTAFAALLPLAQRNDFYVVARIEPDGTAPVLAFEQRHDEPHIDQTLADDIQAFVALRHIYDTLHWRGATSPHPDELDDVISELIRATKGRIEPGFPFEDTHELLCGMQGAAGMALHHDAASDVRRARWITALLRDGRFAAEEHWELRRLRELDATPERVFETVDGPHVSRVPSALYWLWRSFFDGRRARLERLLPRLAESDAALLRDAARCVRRALRGRQSLGHIDDLGALAERYRELKTRHVSD